MPAEDDGTREIEEIEASGAQAVPLARFSAVIRERNEARREIATLREQAGQVEALTGRIQHLEEQHQAAAATWEEERGLMAAGLTDPEAIDVARLLHGRLPEEGRPTLGEWVGQLRESPDKAPRALAGYLGGGQQGGQGEARGGSGGEGGEQPAGRRGLGSTRTGQRTDGSQRTSEPLSAEKIVEIRERAVKTGDWSEWKKVRGVAYAP